MPLQIKHIDVMRLLFVCLWVFACALHLSALSLPYVFDDVFILQNNAWMVGPPPPGLWFTSYFADQAELFPAFRPITLLSFWSEAHVWGPSIEIHRAVNSVIHFANAVLILYLVKSLTPWSRATRHWISLLFFLHPIQTVGIAFIWKRSSLLSLCMCLVAFLSLIFMGRSQTRVKKIVWSVLSCGSFALSVYSKETGLYMGLSALAMWFFLGEWRKIHLNYTMGTMASWLRRKCFLRTEICHDATMAGSA